MPEPKNPQADSIFYQDRTVIRTKPDAPVFDDGCQVPSGGGGDRADGTGQRDFGNWLCIFSPGTNPTMWEPGTVKKIPAGSKIIL